MMKEGVGKYDRTMSKKLSSLAIILNLLLSIFAITFILYSTSIVSAQDSGTNEGLGISKTDLDSLGKTAPAPRPSPNLPQANRAASSTPAAAIPTSTDKIASLEQPYTAPLEAGTTVGGRDVMTFSKVTVRGEHLYATDSENNLVLGDNGQPVEVDGFLKDQNVNLDATRASATPAPDTVNYDKLSPVGVLGASTGTAAYFQYNIIQGFQYSLFAVGAIQLLGGLFGLDKGITTALSLGAFSGIMAAEVAYSLGVGNDAVWQNAISPTTANIIGLGIGLLVFALSYSETDEQKVQFQCLVWQPPRGGESCEKCNVDSKNYPCTEYKCKSLGAGCELLNEGTADAACVWKDPRDVNSPIIEPNYQNLSSGYTYANVHIRPPGLGMEIKNLNTSNNEEGCIEPFFPIEFGVTTNEPTVCKVDYNHTNSFEEMQYYMGESTTYKYNHTQRLSLPGPANVNQESPLIQNDGNYNLFIRCADSNGNENNPEGNVNEDEFAVKFCVRSGPDTTPARIEATNLINGMPVSYGSDKLNFTLYTNEPADCKWSREDKDYTVMENSMSCSRSVSEFNANLLYACKSTLTGIKDREENNFYFRCKDQPQAPENERNTNEESYLFNVKGTQQLNIITKGPNGTIMGSTSIVGVDLNLETANGFKDGEATCYYSRTNSESSYVKFFETGSFIHRQRQDLARGEYTYYFKCVDLGGNADYNKTTIRIEIDERAPRIIRARHDTGESSICGNAGCLQVITDEESVCTYSTTSCNFEIDNGIRMPLDNTKTHYAGWSTDNNYYIKCSDKSGNQPPSNTCSMVVKAVNKK
jgi:hypothetical protein